MVRRPAPADAWSNAVQAMMILAEAQAVIVMRLWGMAGIWAVTPSENSRMLSEKAGAWTRAALDAHVMVLRGGGSDQVFAAAMKPIRQKTRANARRLAKRGPKRR